MMNFEIGKDYICCHEGTLLKAKIIVILKHSLIVECSGIQFIIDKNSVVQHINTDVFKNLNDFALFI